MTLLALRYTRSDAILGANRFRVERSQLEEQQA